MHLVSRKDLNSAKLDTVRVSRNPTTVITANGEVQTNEEATVYVYDLELFVMVQILEDTPAVISQRKLCEEHGYSNVWASGQKPHHIKNGRITMQHGKLRAHRCSGIINGTPLVHCEYILNISTAGLNKTWFYTKSSNHTKSECTQSSTERRVTWFHRKQERK